MQRIIINIISYLFIKKVYMMFVFITLITSFFIDRIINSPIKADLNELLTSNDSEVKTFELIVDEFNNDTRLFIVAKGIEKNLKEYANEIKPLLEDFNQWVSDVHIKKPIEFYRRNTLKLLSKEELDSFNEIIYEPNLLPFLTNVNNLIEDKYQNINDFISSNYDLIKIYQWLDKLELFISLHQKIINGETIDLLGQKLLDILIIGEPYIFDKNNNMLIIQIDPSFHSMINPLDLKKRINGLDSLATKIGYSYGVNTYLSGYMVDYSKDLQYDLNTPYYSLIFWIISLYLFLVVLFRSWLLPILSIVIILLCLIWTFGSLIFLLDHINLILIIILPIFFIFGITICIQIIANYMALRSTGNSIEYSIKINMRYIFSSLSIVTFIYSLLFLTLLLSNNDSMNELGLIGGLGLFILLTSILIISPLIILLKEKNNSYYIKSKIIIIFSDYLKNILNFFLKYYKFILFVFLALSFYFLFYIIKIDINNKNYFPKSDDITYNSEYLMLIVDSISDARNITEKIRIQKGIDRVESISDYLPLNRNLDEQYRYLIDLRKNIKNREIRKHMSSYDMEIYKKEMARLESNIIELQDIALLYNQEELYKKTINFVGDLENNEMEGFFTKFINGLDTNLQRIELIYLHQEFSNAFKNSIINMANTEPLTLENLPSDIKNRFIGNHINKLIVYVYPNKLIWEDSIDFYNYIVNILQINENIYSISKLFSDLKENIVNDFSMIISITIILAFIIILFIYRKIKYAIFCILLLVISIIWQLGIMYCFNMPLDPIALYVAIILFGLGIGNTIYLIDKKIENKNINFIYSLIGKIIFIYSIIIIFCLGPLIFLNNSLLINFIIMLFIGLCVNFISTIILSGLLLRK